MECGDLEKGRQRGGIELCMETQALTFSHSDSYYDYGLHPETFHVEGPGPRLERTGVGEALLGPLQYERHITGDSHFRRPGDVLDLATRKRGL